MSAQPAIPPDHPRALALLADNPEGMTEATMLAHGFTAMLIAELIIAGLASADDVAGNGRELQVTRFKITDAGRRAIAD
jgi:hypothetical protein